MDRENICSPVVIPMNSKLEKLLPCSLSFSFFNFLHFVLCWTFSEIDFPLKVHVTGNGKKRSTFLHTWKWSLSLWLILIWIYLFVEPYLQNYFSDLKVPIHDIWHFLSSIHRFFIIIICFWQFMETFWLICIFQHQNVSICSQVYLIGGKQCDLHLKDSTSSGTLCKLRHLEVCSGIWLVLD